MPTEGERFNLRSVFTGAELDGIRFLEKAVSSAEHRHTVRARLGKGNPGEQMLRHQKYGKILGVFGYDQLPLKPLARIEVGELANSLQGNDRQGGVKGALPETFSHKAKGKAEQSITTLLKKLIGEIELVGWLDPDEREQLVNTFISDLAYRYNSIQQLMVPTFTSQQNRTLITKVFEKIGSIKTMILERCRQKKAGDKQLTCATETHHAFSAMDKLAMFSPDANSCRVISLFRTELNKRVNTSALLRDVSLEMDRGAQMSEIGGLPRFDKLKHEIQEFKDALESVIHPIPHMDPPKLTQKSQNTINRRRLFIENSSEKFPLSVRRAMMLKAMPSNQTISGAKQREHIEAINRDLAEIMGRNLETEEESEESDVEDGIAVLKDLKKTYGNKMQDNPVLQAHTLSSNFERRKDRQEFKSENPKRYLSQDHYTTETLSFDYSVMDKLEEEIMGKNIDTNFPSFVGPNKMYTRPLESRVSLRVPKGFITLSAEPAAAVSEFGSEVDAKLINSLDEKLSRFKEVEELYDEIMKTVNGFHLETSDESSEHIGCPSAPYDPKISLSAAFQGIEIPAFTPTNAQSTSPIPEEDEEHDDFSIRSPSVRLRTRDNRNNVTVSPDEFIKDRNAAMRKTLSSRYNVLKYNFGGYIPYDIDKKRKKKIEAFNTADYINYLRTRTCDFVMDLLVDREKDDEDMRKLLEEQEYLRSVEEENRKAMEVKIRQSERIRNLTEYKDGVWNAGILDYMEEIQQAGARTSLNSKEGEASEGRPKTASSLKLASSAKPGDPDASQPASSAAGGEPHLQTLRATKQTSFQKRESSLDILEAQNHLEQLWVALKMPVDQKLDMAIKYGSAKFAQKLKTAIELWETARNYIIDRENLLKEIEEFETVASDP
ncbi:Coiled-coil domain-containing protein 87, partial [Dinochytrium kinnereticum]